MNISQKEYSELVKKASPNSKSIIDIPKAFVIGGLIYQAVFFAVCMYLAVKMFTSDLLFTMNFSADSGRKKSLLKGAIK